MAAQMFFVFSNPVEGREDEYNDWYNNVHLAEVCQVPSINSAQRFKLSASLPGADSAWQYVAIYQCDNDDPSAILAELRKGLPLMNLSTAINTSTAAGWVFSPVSDVVTG